MSNFQSYQSYVPHEEVFTAAPTIRQDSPVFRTSTTSGVSTDSMEQSIDRGNSGHSSTASGWQATARNTDGRAIDSPDINPDTLVTINGLQGKVSFFVSEGILSKSADGSFTEGPGPAPAPQESQGDIEMMPPDLMAGINAALEPLPQYSLDVIAAQGISLALGKSDDAALTREFSKASGIELADSHERLSAVKGIYQAQANNAIKSRAGIGAADAPDFWAWCRASHGRQLQDAIGKQLHGADMSGYTKLASRWMSETAPSITALKAAGLPTRSHDSGPEVYLKGSWMSPSAAARAGLI